MSVGENNNKSPMTEIKMNKVIVRCFITCALIFNGVFGFAGVDDLTIELKFSQGSYADDEQVRLSYTLINNGSEPVGILNWKLPKGMGEWEEDLFSIDRDGQPVAYKGRHVKRGKVKKSDYHYLNPGKKLTGKAVLTTGYDFADSGYYTISYKAQAMYLTDTSRQYKSKGVETFVSQPVSVYVGGRKYAKPDDNGGGGGGNVIVIVNSVHHLVHLLSRKTVRKRTGHFLALIDID